MEGTNWSFVAAASSAVVALVFGMFTAQQLQYSRVLEVIRLLSVGDVASARHSLGTLAESGDTADHNSPEAIQALFVVLWGFTIVHATWRSLPGWAFGPRQLMRTSVEPFAKYWIANGQRLIRSSGASVSDQTLAGLNGLRFDWELGGAKLSSE